MKKLIYISVLVLVAFLAGAVLAVVVQQFLIPSTATVTNVGLQVYIDNELWVNGTELDWSPVEPNSTYYFSNLTALNSGSVNFTVTLTAPNLPTDWTLTWTANGTVLAPNQMAQAELTLYVPVNVVAGQTYTWDMWINADR